MDRRLVRSSWRWQWTVQYGIHGKAEGVITAPRSSPCTNPPLTASTLSQLQGLEINDDLMQEELLTLFET
jgi:hypothetical protein